MTTQGARKNIPVFTEMVLTLAVNRVKLRYRNSLFGFVWSMLHPLIYLGIFVLVFSNVMRGIDNYPLYALTGLIFWGFFANTSGHLITSVIESSAILKSINIPSIVFPISSMASGVINLLLSLIPFTILMYFFGFQLGWVTLLVLPALVLFGLFTLGICLFMCAINVYFRDIGILWSSLTPAMFYFTPIVYAPELVPEQYRWALKFNPIYHFMEIFRDILYYNQLPSGNALAITGGLTVIALILGTLTFRKLERGFISNY